MKNFMKILGFVIIGVCYKSIEQSMLVEINNELRNIAISIETGYDAMYPGDYSVKGTSYVAILKGDSVISGKSEYIDEISKKSGIEISIFYGDTRIATTLGDKNGSRYVGKTAPAHVIKSVEKEEKEMFYPSVVVEKDRYYAYYKPIYNSDGAVVGMIELAKASDIIKKDILKSVLQPLITFALAILIVAIITNSFANNLSKTIASIDDSVNKIAGGNLSTDIDTRILKREDELGRIAKSIKSMARELRGLVEEDALTGISNRRSGESQLKKMIMQSAKDNFQYVVVMGDIDYFKGVNDKYGHDAGDVVLKGIAGILKKHARRRGIVSRWGGEEFMLAFDECNVKEAKALIQVILDEIRNTDFISGKAVIKATMTFGIAQCDSTMNAEQAIKSADDLLYEGKQSGRNQITTKDSRLDKI